jgi:hypothetical protein
MSLPLLQCWSRTMTVGPVGAVVGVAVAIAGAGVVAAVGDAVGVADSVAVAVSVASATSAVGDAVGVADSVAVAVSVVDEHEAMAKATINPAPAIVQRCVIASPWGLLRSAAAGAAHCRAMPRGSGEDSPAGSEHKA